MGTHATRQRAQHVAALQAGDDALEARWFCPEELAAEKLALSLDVREVIALAQK